MSIVEAMRQLKAAADAAEPSVAAMTDRVRDFGIAGAEAVRSIDAAAASAGDGGGGGRGERPTGAAPTGPGLARVPLGSGAPSSGGPGRGAASGRGGFLAAGAETSAGEASGGPGGGAGTAALTSGFQRVEGALQTGLGRLVAVPTAGERALLAGQAATTAAINRLTEAIGRSDGGASFRARAGLGL